MFWQETRAVLAQYNLVIWKRPDDMDGAVEELYSTLQVSESLDQFVKGGNWHLLSVSMEGLTKRWLTSPS